MVSDATINVENIALSIILPPDKMIPKVSFYRYSNTTA